MVTVHVPSPKCWTNPGVDHPNHSDGHQCATQTVEGRSNMSKKIDRDYRGASGHHTK